MPLSGSIDLAPTVQETSTGCIFPFNEAPREIVTGVSIVNTSSIDTSSFDAYRQGVELTCERHYQQGVAKIHSGEPETGHRIFQTGFGMGYKSSRIRKISFDDSIVSPPSLTIPQPQRYDMSGCKLWYKCLGWGSPLSNSGDGGARALAYNYDGAADGEATYRAMGIFGDCLDFHDPHKTTKYGLQIDDSAWFGVAQSIWCWITPHDDSSKTESYLWGRRVWNGTGEFALYLNGSAGRTVTLQCNFVGGGAHIEYTSLAAAYSYEAPHLISATYDGADINVYVNGVNVCTAAHVDAINASAAGHWNLGCAVNFATYSAVGLIHDFGFDDSVISEATFKAMYKAGVL